MDGQIIADKMANQPEEPKLVAPEQRVQFTDPSQGLKDGFIRAMPIVQKLLRRKNSAVEDGAQKFAELSDMKMQAGAGRDELYQPIANVAAKSVADYITPSPANVLFGGVIPTTVATNMVQNGGKSAAELYREAKVLQSAAKFGKTIVKEAPRVTLGKVTVLP